MRVLKLVGLIFVSFAFAACEKPNGNTFWVDMPSFYVYCRTSACSQNHSPNPRITAQLTTSGCTNPATGLVRTSSTIYITCTTTYGCQGTLYDWTTSEGRSTTGVPEGTYSMCVRIDYDRNYPASTSGDTIAEWNDVTIDETDANTTQFIENVWTDQ